MGNQKPADNNTVQNQPSYDNQHDDQENTTDAQLFNDQQITEEQQNKGDKTQLPAEKELTIEDVSGSFTNIEQQGSDIAGTSSSLCKDMNIANPIDLGIIAKENLISIADNSNIQETNKREPWRIVKKIGGRTTKKEAIKRTQQHAIGNKPNTRASHHKN